MKLYTKRRAQKMTTKRTLVWPKNICMKMQELSWNWSLRNKLARDLEIKITMRRKLKKKYTEAGRKMSGAILSEGLAFKLELGLARGLRSCVGCCVITAEILRKPRTISSTTLGAYFLSVTLGVGDISRWEFLDFIARKFGASCVDTEKCAGTVQVSR